MELESKEPTEMGDDTSSSEDEEVRGAVVTSVEHHEPMAASVDGGMMWTCAAMFLSRGSTL